MNVSEGRRSNTSQVRAALREGLGREPTQHRVQVLAHDQAVQQRSGKEAGLPRIGKKTRRRS